MTTTEVRPHAAGDDERREFPLPQMELPRTPRRGGGLARRLPWAVAVLTLAGGYAVGHNTNNPVPKVTAQPNLVTPQQINAALTPSNGQKTLPNDRGFGALENGIQHSHGIDLPVTKADRKVLSHQMDLARRTAMKYPTLADAERAGARRAGPFAPGLGTHMIMAADYGYMVGSGPITDAQIEHPLAWIYDGTHPDSPVAGLFYMSSDPKTIGFAGPNDIWHKHKHICTVLRADGGTDTPFGADRPVSKAQCASVHGQLLEETPPLIHVWPVPGYEDNQGGVYGHTSPAITCDDGSYHMIPDISKIGLRTSACVDGTE